MLLTLIGCTHSTPDLPVVPLSGGGLAVDRDGTVWLSDPDGGRVVHARTDGSVIEAFPAEQPARIALGDRQVVAVVRGGRVLSIDRGTGATRDGVVCAAPRGIEVDGGEAWVACAEGVLVRVDLADVRVLRTLPVEEDLRDVVTDADGLWVTRFRAAEVLRVDPATGKVLDRRRPEVVDQDVMPVDGDIDPFSPYAAVRTVANPAGGLVMLHSRGADGPIDLDPGPDVNPYVDRTVCGADVASPAVTWFERDGATQSSLPLPGVGVPIDLAVGADGRVHLATSARDGTLSIGFTLEGVGEDCGELPAFAEGSGHGTAVAMLPDDEPVLLSRFPLALAGDRAAIVHDDPLPIGFDVFHRATDAGIACVSCHPDGHEDGRTWRFVGLGPRRTQDVGQVGDSGPFHWAGDLATLDDLLVEVHRRRMGADRDPDGTGDALAEFLAGIPRLPPAPGVDPGAVARGGALFGSAGCAGCHTDPPPERGYDVGTGGEFQVPRLVGVAGRVPLMHDGCAATIRDRFDPACGGTAHGDTAALSDADVDDLVAWLSAQ